ncbi:hypothetical protein F8388_019710, partial [Cannabis sativa]
YEREMRKPTKPKLSPENTRQRSVVRRRSTRAGATTAVFSVCYHVTGLDFFAMIFPVVHIGAIAVSFLFVVMMFHIQIAEIHEEVLRYLPAWGGGTYYSSAVWRTPTHLKDNA